MIIIIRILFKYEYKYAILLDNLCNGGKLHFFLNFDTLYSGVGMG